MWERTWAYIRKAGTIILAVTIIIWAGLSYPELPQDIIDTYDTQRKQIETQLPDADEASLEEALADVDNEQALAALRNSYAGRLGVTLEPISEYAGFNWRVNLALIGGFAAKEVVVSTLGTAYSLGDVDPEEAESLQNQIKADSSWNIATGISFIIFVLIYAPCFPTLAVIKQESASWGWMIFATVFNTVLAFLLAVAAYQILYRVLVL